MHRSRPAGPRRAALALLLALAACDGRAADPLAHPDDLQMTIVRGGGQHASVRPFGEQPADSLVVHTPVVVRIALATDLEAEDGVTGPSGGVRLPPVTVHWRTLDPFCQVVEATTQVEPGSDSTVNRYVRPTRSGVCRLVAEATAEGRPVGRPDTAAIHFNPGPPVRIQAPAAAMIEPFRGAEINLFPVGLFDAHGNFVRPSRITYELSGGAPQFYVEHAFVDWLRTRGEGIGEVTATADGLSVRVQVWALEVMGRSSWRLSWECYGMDRPDGVRVDSVHLRMDTAQPSYGGLSPRGVALTLTGTLVRREWVRGEPVRETRTPEAQVFAAKKPGVVEWSATQAAPETAAGYVGGTLCQPDPGGAAWSRTSPAQLIRRPLDVPR
ncbi:MAG TPA: hypothetical protein VGC13_27455 [Longimicrobium sp.]|jgi:hypothetical protein|uniref:hypothetical protein n=1 Tax=Longimicrobium sp. TaxID=2029185 RepID=UPI002ED82289